MKKCLIQGYPLMFLFYINDEDYHDIIPAIGLQFTNENQYHPYYYLSHQKQIQRKISQNDFLATRKHCGEGGCISGNVRILF